MMMKYNKDYAIGYMASSLQRVYRKELVYLYSLRRRIKKEKISEIDMYDLAILKSCNILIFNRKSIQEINRGIKQEIKYLKNELKTVDDFMK